MKRRDRVDVVALLAAALLTFVLLLVFAGRACPTATEQLSCPSAAVHRAIVVVLASGVVGLVVAPFAFIGEFAARRRIVYRGAWARAARRGVLAGLLVAALAGLRLCGALTPVLALFLLAAPIILDAYLTRSELRR